MTPENEASVQGYNVMVEKTRRHEGPTGFTSLVLPGGGARGAYQVGVLKAIAEFAPEPDNPFPIVVGTSVGAINAVAVASYAGHYQERIAQLEQLWLALQVNNVYVTDFFPMAARYLHWLSAIVFGRLGIGHTASMLNNSPLRDLLEKTIDFAGIDNAINNHWLHAVAVSASGYSSGRVTTFFQGIETLQAWQRSRRDGVKAILTTGHLMASASLPFLFPAQQLGREYFGDGSLRLTAPLNPAIQLGAERILVIGVRDNQRNVIPKNPKYPTLGDLAGYMLDIVFNDNLDNDIDRLCRINDTLSIMPAATREKTTLRHVAIKAIMPSKDLRTITSQYADALPWTMKTLLKSVGAWHGNWRMPSYLLFEHEYIKVLIELGYSDAMTNKDEIYAFLAGEDAESSSIHPSSPDQLLEKT